MKFAKLGLASSFALVLAACGGGGSSDTPAAAPAVQVSAPLVITGVGATGLAIPSATVTAKCQGGTGAATTNASGGYSLTIAGASFPCMLELSNPANGALLYSVATGDGSNAISNITPLTNLLVARLLVQAPDAAFKAFGAATAPRITSAAVSRAQADIVSVLRSAVDVGTIENFVTTLLTPATTSNPAGGDAQDKLLDELGLKLSGNQQVILVSLLVNGSSVSDAASLVASSAAIPVPVPALPAAASHLAAYVGTWVGECDGHDQDVMVGTVLNGELRFKVTSNYYDAIGCSGPIIASGTPNSDLTVRYNGTVNASAPLSASTGPVPVQVDLITSSFSAATPVLTGSGVYSRVTDGVPESCITFSNFDVACMDTSPLFAQTASGGMYSDGTYLYHFASINGTFIFQDRFTRK